MFKILSALVVAFLLSACQSTVSIDKKSEVVKNVGKNGSSSFLSHSGYGTKFAYNENSSLTAAHVKAEALNDMTVLKQHPRCDVALIQSNNKSNVNVIFSESKLNDKVVVYGHPEGGKSEKSVSGSIIGYKTSSHQDYTKDCHIAIIDVKVKKGMSGGPVYNSENKVVGIIFAVDKNKEQSYMVPYESFKEWLN